MLIIVPFNLLTMNNKPQDFPTYSVPKTRLTCENNDANYKIFQEHLLNSGRFPVFPGAISNSRRFPGVVDIQLQ